ncbi:hypothetical protein [Kitasatospora nipponensis]
MTLRAYRRTPTGAEVELSRSAVHLGEPYQHPITLEWPPCHCPRCEDGEDTVEEAPPPPPLTAP